jgi:hypothetical protein
VKVAILIMLMKLIAFMITFLGEFGCNDGGLSLGLLIITFGIGIRLVCDVIVTMVR